MSINSHLYRRDDPATSKRAAGRVQEFALSHEARIFGVLHASKRGATYREIAATLDMEPVAVARRLKGMESKGLVKREWLGTCLRGHTHHYESRDNMTVWRAA
jgi:DNA-binding MarR family transcriptional regulator